MRPNSLIQFTLSNLGWIAASVFLAMVVWVAASMSNNPVEQREISNILIEVKMPEGFVLDRPVTQPATAVVRAAKSEWRLIVTGDILVTADLGDIREPGEYRIELEGAMAPRRRANVVAIRPSTLTLVVDHEAEARVGVKVIVSKEPPLGYTYPPDLACDQTEVVVHGSAEKVESVQQVEVRMDLSDERNPLTRSYDLIPVQENGRTVTNVELVPPSVTCTVDIQAREDVFQMRVLPTVINDPPEGYIFESYVANPETVGVSGDGSAISAMGGVVRTVPIDLTDETETFTAQVPLSLPAGVSLVPENQMISVSVTVSAVRSSRQFPDVPVEVTGLDPTLYRATVLPNAVTVLVAGPEALLPNRDDLRVTVDLSGLPAGNHQVTPLGEIIVESVNGEMSVSVRPEQLSVTIEPLNPTPAPSPTPTPEASATPNAALSPPAVTTPPAQEK